MSEFKSKKITEIQTLGEKLKKHREDMGLSIEKAAKKISLNPNYLRSLEQNDYGRLPAEIYTGNILKIYAKLLKLNPHLVIDIYKKEKTLFEKIKRKKEEKKLTWRNKMANFFLNPKTIKYFVFLVVVLSVVFYLSFELRKIFTPPFLEIVSPPDNYLTADSQILLQGQTEKEIQLKINNRLLLSDPQGKFEITLNLQNGLN
ncbi:MAG: helix-turn-helix domain-containing protein, partial [Patescibacteria group bacterium]